ncbi:MAG: 6-phosphofructokinase [Acidimicrobiia bacterium]
MRVAMLTGGGDCPGLNAVIRAIVRKGEYHYGDELIGFYDSWQGVMDQNYRYLDVRSLRGMLPRGGTLLGTRRGSCFDTPDGVQRVKESFAALEIDGLVVIGGNGSLTVARMLWDQESLPLIGVPKTIDNDIAHTDVTFGFNTAVQIATDAIDRLHTTAESHDRVMLVEVMGRNSGWIATYAGIAGGATVILIPEQPFDLDEVCRILKRRHERGRYASIVVVAEGAKPVPGTLDMPEAKIDQFGHERLGGIANRIAPEIEERTGFETRVTTLGHIQRGGTPTAFDRVLSTRYGLAAIDAVHDGSWGNMVALDGDEIELVTLAEATSADKPVDTSLFRDVASVFFG